ncbi:hypothetical protein AB7M37_002817 [Sinorhizobium fredii]
MDGQKAVLLPFAKEEADCIVSRYLGLLAGDSERRLNVIVEGHLLGTARSLKGDTAPGAVKD